MFPSNLLVRLYSIHHTRFSEDFGEELKVGINTGVWIFNCPPHYSFTAFGKCLAEYLWDNDEKTSRTIDHILVEPEGALDI